MTTREEFDKFVNDRSPCRTCPHCKADVHFGHPDPCLGYMPGVLAACCGHGNTYSAYVFFTNGLVVRHFDVVEFLGLPTASQQGLYPRLRAIYGNAPKSPTVEAPGPSSRGHRR